MHRKAYYGTEKLRLYVEVRSNWSSANHVMLLTACDWTIAGPALGSQASVIFNFVV